MRQHIFTYGSLMFPQVWQRVVRGSYRSAAATVVGHARFAITGETYPGMVACAGAAVRGVLYFDVAPEDVAALNTFEGPDYRLDTIELTLDSGEAVKAGAYIYLKGNCLSDQPWLPERFQMQRFLETYCGFGAEGSIRHGAPFFGGNEPQASRYNHALYLIFRFSPFPLTANALAVPFRHYPCYPNKSSRSSTCFNAPWRP